MYARIAEFESDPETMDQMIEGVRANLEGGGGEMTDEQRDGLSGVRRVLMLIDRQSGKGAGVVFTDSEDDLRRADAALNSMTPQGGVQRTSVGLYEVAIDREMN